MNTLHDMHDKKGTPDLSHWRTVKIFTIAEASLLTAGFDPLEYSNHSDYHLFEDLRNNKPLHWQHVLMLIRSITEAICTHEIKSPYINVQCSDINSTWDDVIEQAKISIDDAKDVIYTTTKIHRDELYKWLNKNGFIRSLSPQKDKHVTTVNNIEKTINNNDTLLLPQINYSTPAINAAIAVIKEFWEDYNPNGDQPPPKQDYVKQWLSDNHPEIESNILREAIDKICRHPEAKNGGNSKIKQKP
jgi:hypothetical protein